MPDRVKHRTDTSTNRDSDKIIVRLPEGMRDTIKRMAAVNGRSMNAEIVLMLQRIISPQTDAALKVVEELMGKEVA